MWLINLAFRRPFTVLVAVLGVALGSGIAAKRMPVDIFPDLNIPVIYVAPASHTQCTYDVDGGQDPNEQGEYCKARQRVLDLRHEFGQVDDKQIGVGSRRRYLSQPEHPGGLDSGESPECGARIQIRTASLIEARGNLGEAGDDGADAQTRQHDRPGAEAAGEACHGGRQAKDAAADDAVDGERDQAPAANGADQMSGRPGDGRVGHKQGCITREIQTCAHGREQGPGFARRTAPSTARRAGLGGRPTRATTTADCRAPRNWQGF
jgi:hypothetical protein